MKSVTTPGRVDCTAQVVGFNGFSPAEVTDDLNGQAILLRFRDEATGRELEIIATAPTMAMKWMFSALAAGDMVRIAGRAVLLEWPGVLPPTAVCHRPSIFEVVDRRASHRGEEVR